jgi:hypothetical protein
MKRLRLTTAAALASFGLLCGCATNSNSNSCGERQGLFSRWFGGNRSNGCDCVETGRITGGEGPVVPDPSFGEQTYPVAPPTFQTAPPIPTMPNSNGLAQPIPAGPASQIKDARR